MPNTGAWPKPNWNLDSGHKRIPDEELKRIKDSFPVASYIASLPPQPDKLYCYICSDELELHTDYSWWCPGCERKMEGY